MRSEAPRPDLLAVLCECGCGEPAPIAVKTVSREGAVKGQPRRFIHGHNGRVRPRKPPRKRETMRVDEPRFWGKAEEDPATGCWTWKASLTPGGYGQFSFWPTVVSAHRLSWELMRGPIPDGLHLDHLCRNRACINPEHLEPVTPAVNQARGMRGYEFRTKCRSGRHDITDPVNVYIRPNGKRQCHQCCLEASRRRHGKA